MEALHAQLGHPRLALTYCQKALGLHREVGNRFGEALTLDSLATLRHQAGRHNQAIALHEQALTAYRDAGDRYYHARTLIHLAETHHVSGNSQSAQRAWQQASAILDDMDHPGAADIWLASATAKHSGTAIPGPSTPCRIAGTG